jgi:hypothetical protein
MLAAGSFMLEASRQASLDLTTLAQNRSTRAYSGSPREAMGGRDAAFRITYFSTGSALGGERSSRAARRGPFDSVGQTPEIATSAMPIDIAGGGY